MIEDIYKRMNEESSKIFKDRKVVFGEGNTGAEIMLIGEAPGGEEEKQGHPFVGSAGKNLNGFLEILELKREDIFLSNVVKIRPFKINEKTGRKVNRPPDKSEIDFFKPFLIEEIKEVSPKLIVTLGNTALRAVTDDKSALIGDFHGKVTETKQGKLFALYHPASIIYNIKLKDTYNSDLQILKGILKKEKP